MERVSGSYSRLLKLASADESSALILLRSLWPIIVGKGVANFAQPETLDQKVLMISVADHTWKSELDGMCGVLRQRVNDFWGMELVKSISLTLRKADRQESPSGSPELP